MTEEEINHPRKVVYDYLPAFERKRACNPTFDYSGWFGNANEMKGVLPTDVSFQMTMQYLPLQSAVTTGRAKNTWYKNVTDKSDGITIAGFEDYISGRKEKEGINYMNIYKGEKKYMIKVGQEK